MNGTTDWNKLDYSHLIESCSDKKLQSSRKRRINEYMTKFTDKLVPNMPTKDDNSTAANLSYSANTTTDSSFTSLLSTSSSSSMHDSTAKSLSPIKSSSSSSQQESVHDISMDASSSIFESDTSMHSTNANHSHSLKQSDKHFNASKMLQPMEQKEHDVPGLDPTYQFKMYLHDTTSAYEFQDHDQVQKAKPCHLLRKSDLHNVQCLQSFLYIVYRSDPFQLDIPFFKVSNVFACSFTCVTISTQAASM